jgi:uroporphyrinogen III methyltransferase/synthase
MQRGKVYLVGAGPGDPGLLTLRAVECLGRANVVLYDYLANPRVLRHAGPDAECISLGAHGRTKIWTQAQINARMVEDALAGKVVVRLKGGDPSIFGRLAEELEALRAANIAYEVVPGITAASAAAAYAGISITHRDLASAVALVTGHEDAEKESTALDYPALAAFPGTLVFYMGVTKVREWTSGLLAAGKPATTPVAIIRRASLADQKVITTTLGETADALTPASKLRPPVVVIVGEVATTGAALSWFEKRPLFGQRIAVTRAAQQNDELRAKLEALGAEVLEQPAIEIRPPSDWSAVDAALADLSTFDWVVFSSTNGVEKFLDRLYACGHDARALGKAKLAAIGPGTAAKLADYRLNTDILPDEYRAEALAAVLSAEAKHKKFLLIRASRGREVLAEQLTAAGGHVEQVVVYDSLDVTTPDARVAQLLSEGQLDWLTVTSSAIARSLVNLFGDDLRKTKLASISPITSATLRELGHDPAAEAREYTMQGIVEAIAGNQKTPTGSPGW